MTHIFYTCFFILTVFISSAQTNVDLLLDCTDAYLGADDFVINGLRYIPPGRQINGKVYYEGWRFRPGKVFIEEEAHELENLLYDLFHDQLILQYLRDDGTIAQLVLNPNALDSFQIEDRIFIPSRHLQVNDSPGIYVEKLAYKSTVLFRDQSVIFSPQFSTKNPAGKFVNGASKFYFLNDGELISMDRGKDFIKIFPERKKEINQYLRKERFKFKKASHQDFIQLLSMLNEL